METDPSRSARHDARWSTVARQYLPHCETPLLVPVTFGYRRSDPLRVRAAFHCPQNDDVVWDLGRDLLAAGTRSASGGGDVLVWPADGTESQPQVWLRLGPQHTHALLALDRTRLLAWLDTTYALVPADSEEDHLDWRPIELLLAGH
ncbi:SsgA family sporulation/cell division regulator [Streptomyces sp. NPDC048507]|uniref:SsgA family sporulation/cell division regulator n=1 Tax=Streptomyces sp. NPDC048507 TaxID=3365560 RepID=UPI003723B001